ncbi:putative glutamine synthetase [Helianthus anomalus]
MSTVTDFMNLNLSTIHDKFIAEYIWIGGSGMDIRSKARTLSGSLDDPQKLPKWNYDGSSTGQAHGHDTEVILYPQAIFKDPFRRGNNILVSTFTFNRVYTSRAVMIYSRSNPGAVIRVCACGEDHHTGPVISRGTCFF